MQKELGSGTDSSAESRATLHGHLMALGHLSATVERLLASAGETLSDLPSESPDLTYRLLFGQVVLAHRTFDGLLTMLSQLLDDGDGPGKYGSPNLPVRGIPST